MRNQYLFAISCILFLCSGIFNLVNAQADVCYAVAEDNGTPNTLFVLNGGVWSQVGITGTGQLEAIAIDPNTGIIYAADAGTLGTLDPNTGAFTAIGTVGSGNGSIGTMDFDDIDGLSWDDNLGILWASNREGAVGANDLLLQIDPVTGSFIPSAFAGGDDYVVVEEAFDGTLGTDVFDVDDIAWNPQTSQLFAIQNEDGPGVISIINQFDGSLQQIVYDTPDEDLEGLGFDSDGDLFATSGDNGDSGSQNSFIQIDFVNQSSTILSSIDPTGDAVDFESFDCYRLPDVTPLAGSLNADSPVCMQAGSAVLSATTLVNPLIPAGFQLAYVLTSGTGLVIEQTATAPTFTVNSPGNYKIHTLVYDPNTLNLANITPGFTTGFDVNNLLVQGGGNILAALDVLGACINVLPGTDIACICNEDNLVQQVFPCYAVSEDNSAPNTLWEYDANTGVWTEIGVTGTASLEAIAANPITGDLNAVDAGTFGVLNRTTGAFTAIGAVGSGNGALGTISLDDIDGLTFDAVNNILWATHRVGGTGPGTNDLLLQINPNTGSVITGAFAGDDYVVVEEVFDGTFGADVYDVDDIALNPFTGELFAIQNQDGPGVISILNTTNGQVVQTVYDTPDEDLEGLGFDVFGNLFATSGDNGDSGAQNSFIQIDYINGVSNVIGTIDPSGTDVDFESFDCFPGFHDLAITKSLASGQTTTINNGETVTFDIEVTNVGQFIAADVTVMDVIPAGLSFVSGDFTINGAGNGMATLLCALEPGSSETLTITLEADVPCAANGVAVETLTNNAQVISSNSFFSIPGVGVVELNDINPVNDIDSENINVNAGALVVNSTIIDESCAGSNDGSILLTPTGTAPYTYIWSNGATTQNINNIAAGNYGVVVTDDNGCTAQLNNLIVNSASLVAISLDEIIQSECSATNGGIDISVSNGTAPYTYSWSNGASTQDLSNVAAGSYTVSVTDDNGCSTSETYAVSSTNSNITLVETVTDESCSGSANGSINLIASGGTAPYSYNWSNGATTQNISNLSAGSYSVVVNDANGCSDNLIDITVGAGNNITINNPTIINTSCSASTGSITVQGANGVAPYSYSWSNGATSATNANLSAGSYTVTVTDANGCSNSETYAVSSTNSNITLIETVTDESCTGSANGSINLIASGGTAPYSYNWSNGATTQNISNLSAGNYSVVVNDANGCSDNLIDITVGAGNNISINNPTIINTSCSASTGSITVQGANGTAPYSYSWSNGATSATNANLSAGSYTVTVTDDNGCSNSETYAVSSTNSNIVLNPAVINPACLNESTGSITLNPTGGTAPYTYVWSNGMTTASLNNLPAGTYSATVTDANGCTTNSGAIQLMQGSSVSVSGTVVDATDVQPGSINISVFGGATPYTYLWNTGATSQNINNIGGGTYTVQVTDANGCTETETFVVEESCVNCSFDLSLTKDLTPGQSAYYGGNISAGDDISYTITVVNQGDFAAQNVVVADYIPNGLTLSINDVNGWSPIGFGNISNIIPGVIPPGGSASVDVMFTVDNSFTFGSILNIAEIVSTNRVDGEPAIDIDSTPDSNVSNDAIAEDDIDNAIVFITPAIPSVAGTLSSPSPICLESGFAAIQAIPTSSSVIPPGFAQLYLLVNATTGVIEDANTTPDFLVTNLGNYALHTFVYDISDFSPASITFGSTQASTVINSINNGSIDASIELPGAAVSVVSCAMDLSLIKDLADNQSAIVGVNETVEFTITVTNQGTFAMNNIQITDYLPAGLILAGNNIGWSLDNGDYTHIVPVTLNPGEEYMVSIFFQVNPSFEGFILDNFAEIISAQAADGSVYVDIDSQPDQIFGNDPIQEDDFDDASILIVGALCDLQIANASIIDAGCGNSGSIAVSPSGGSGIYNYSWSTGATSSSISNLAPGNYTVTVTDSDNCSATQTYSIISSGSNLSVDGVVFDVSCNNLGGVNTTVIGGVAPYTYSWSNGSTTANISGVSAGNYAVSVSDASGCSGSANFAVNNFGNTGCQFDLALTQGFINNNPQIYTIGENVTYIITVTNQGDVVANNVSIIDYIPTGLTLNDNDWTASGGDAVYTIPGTIPPGGSVAVPITFTVNSSAFCGSLKNAAEITNAFELNGSVGFDIDSTPDSNESNDIVIDDEVNNFNNDEDDHDISFIIVDCPPANIDLSLNKSINPVAVPVGGTATYTITVNNSTLGDATGITVMDLLPNGVTYLSDDAFGSYVPNTGMWTIGSLTAGQTATLNITCIINNHSTAVNTAQIMSHDQTDIDSTPGNGLSNEDDQDSASPIPPVIAQIDLALNKNVSPINVNAAGDIVTWTIIVSNQSAATATGVIVSDNLPTGLTYMTDNSGGAYNANTGLWTVGTIAGGANEVLQITTLVNDISSAITNYAQVNFANENDIDSNPGNNSTTEDDDDNATIIPTVQPCNSTINTCTQPITPVVICPVYCDYPNAVIIDAETLFDCSIEFLANGCLEYTPLPGLTITDEITITAQDANGNIEIVTAFVDIGCDGFIINEDDLPIENLQENESDVPFKVIKTLINGNTIAIDFENDAEELIDYQLVSMNGKTIKVGTIEAFEGYNTFTIEDVNIITGLYVVTLNDGKSLITKKVMIN